MCLLAICMSSLEKFYSELLSIFQLYCLFWWCWVSWAIFRFWRLTPCRSHRLRLFFPSVGYLFCLFSFAVQKFLSLSRSQLFVFVFISIILEDRSKKILLQFMSEWVLPIFSSRSFIVSSLTLSSLIHFELMFMYCVKEWSNFFFFLHIAFQLSQHHLLKRLSFQHCVVLPPFS